MGLGLKGSLKMYWSPGVLHSAAELLGTRLNSQGPKTTLNAKPLLQIKKNTAWLRGRHLKSNVPPRLIAATSPDTLNTLHLQQHLCNP